MEPKDRAFPLVTPLFMASKKGHVEVVKELITHPQIDINRPNSKTGMTPIYIASSKGDVETVNELISHPQIDINLAPRRSGITPLHAASRMGHVDVVKTLLADQRVNVNQADMMGATPLFIAAAFPSYSDGYDERLEVIKLLLSDPRVDPNQLATANGNPNAITVATTMGNLEIVQLFLRCPNVILGVKDLSGRSEFDYAKESNPRSRVPDELKLQILEAIESRETLLEQGHTC